MSRSTDSRARRRPDSKTSRRLGPAPGSRGPLEIGRGRVLVYGLGRSGLAAAHLLTHHGVRFGFYDDQEIPGYRNLSDRIRWPEVQVHFQTVSQEMLLGYELVVVSPGVPAHTPALLALEGAGLKVISEIELAFAFASAPIVAVTGTNGKTTTVTMAQLLLAKAGFASVATGNIGYPFSLAVQESTPDYWVVEVSSFQLHHIDRFAPAVAIITSFAPNHLDWHGDEESYFRAKMNIAANLTQDRSVVYPSTCGQVRRALVSCPALKIPFGPRGALTLSPERGILTRRVAGGRAVPYLDLKRLGPALSYDWRLVSESIQAVAGLAAAMDLPGSTIEEMLVAFTPLKHRIEVIGVREGVTYVNDSKSTSVDATIYALKKQHVPVVLMLGGRDKGLAFTDLVPAARGRVKAVVAFGEAREKIAREIGQELPIHLARDLPEAVDRARHLAGPGELVLFSPACASFDQFKNYEERGESFRRIVNSFQR
ncbi:MAG: UDP-N-acetylmuramoyl-L-alanine--D-glutamate ligase [Candidatus Riflebacteria bacterium]|nr:UDP-N-acetylmuramoyl-L-alanine--D-glutamate ligase [Candidatus Riflebacteria bacterium]